MSTTTTGDQLKSYLCASLHISFSACLLSGRSFLAVMTPMLDIKVTSHNVPVIVDKASTNCPSTAPWSPALLRTFPVLAIASGMRIRLWLFSDTSLRSPASSTCVTLSDTLFSWSQKQSVTSICNHLDNSRHVGSQLCSFVPILSLHSGVPCVLVLAHGQPLW